LAAQGSCFWDLALREHAAFNTSGNFDEALSSMFRNVDSRTGKTLGVDDGKGAIRTLKARAVLVDMENGVINALLKSPNADLYDAQQLVHDVSGSGNNFAHGHFGVLLPSRPPV
jgi:tubulin epsilon